MSRAQFLHALALILAFAPFVQAATPGRELFTCGRERVYLFDLNVRDAAGAPKKLWTWQAAGRRDLPHDTIPLFRSTDECKPIDGGRRVLITSSTGGVALVDREKDAVLFYGRAANAHSADMLPGGRIAVAASRDPREQKGDALILFDVKSPGRELWRTELPAGHGVVWDAQREILWALSGADLRSYRLADWDTATPKLTRLGLFALPEEGGHELFPVPGTAFLAITTASRCWIFDRDRQTITPHPQLGDKSSIKCLSTHPVTGEIAFVQADRPNWWSERIQFLNPTDSLSVGREQFYKVRWNVPRD